MQMPARQFAEPRQAVKQLPQKLSSVMTSTQFVPQSTRGRTQFGRQVPPLHVSPPLHARPHIPQFAGSLPVFTHVLLHAR